MSLVILLVGGWFFLIGKLNEPLRGTAYTSYAAEFAAKTIFFAAWTTDRIKCLDLVMLAAPAAEAAVLGTDPQAGYVAPAAPPAVA